MQTITDWTSIPKFEDEEQEAGFWMEHTPDPSLMNGAIYEGDVKESKTITLRFDPRLLARIKRIARSRYLNYQSMIKQWLSERLEQESNKFDS